MEVVGQKVCLGSSQKAGEPGSSHLSKRVAGEDGNTGDFWTMEGHGYLAKGSGVALGTLEGAVPSGYNCQGFRD